MLDSLGDRISIYQPGQQGLIFPTVPEFSSVAEERELLPNGAIVEATYLRDSGLISKLTTRPLLIDSSTVSRETAKKVAKAAEENGFAAIDAPVMGARAGTLSFIAGGPQTAFEEAKPTLKAMGKNIFHAADNGTEQAAKICNNMLAAISMACSAEALALGVRNGLDPKALTEIIHRSTGNNFMVEKWIPGPGVRADAPAGHDYKGGFQVALMLKDLGLALASAQASGASIPPGATAGNLLALHTAQGDEIIHEDMSSIQRFYAPSLLSKG